MQVWQSKAIVPIDCVRCFHC